MTHQLNHTSVKGNAMTKPMIACIGMNSQADCDANLQIAATAIDVAKGQGAKLVVLPENVASMGRQHATAQRFDELSSHFAHLASKHQLYVLAGTLPCPYRPDGSVINDGRLRQASLLFAPDGSQVARYDKIHLFRATVADNQGGYDEAQTFEAGTQIVTAHLELDHTTVMLGMMVCFDLRFPALAQRLRQSGANLLSAPSAFTYQTGEVYWRLLLQARAIDSQCLVIGSAQGGKHIIPTPINDIQHHLTDIDTNMNTTTCSTIRHTWGHSTITDSRGQILTMDNTSFDDWQNGENSHHKRDCSVITAVFDDEQQHQNRVDLPIFECHRLA